MVFQPKPGATLDIEGKIYHIAEHPLAPGMPYGQEGRRAVVYQLISDQEEQSALKVFKDRFRIPGMVRVAELLEPYASLPGLHACQRTVLTGSRHTELLRGNPELAYAVLMPWVEGPTWQEILLDSEDLTPERSLNIARLFSNLLMGLEEKRLAHCDLSGANLIIQPSDQPALVDLEEMYGPGFLEPKEIPAGSPGYAHKSAPSGIWSDETDRFSGAVLLSEMLVWFDPDVRAAAWGESYFAPKDMQTESKRLDVLRKSLESYYGNRILDLFDQAWRSDSLRDCPTFAEWAVALPAAVGTQVTEAGGIEEVILEEGDVYTFYQQAEIAVKNGKLEKGLDLYRKAITAASPELSRKIEEQIALLDQQLQEGDVEFVRIEQEKYPARSCPICQKTIPADHEICPHCEDVKVPIKAYRAESKRIKPGLLIGGIIGGVIIIVIGVILFGGTGFFSQGDSSTDAVISSEMALDSPTETVQLTEIPLTGAQTATQSYKLTQTMIPLRETATPTPIIHLPGLTDDSLQAIGDGNTCFNVRYVRSHELYKNICPDFGNQSIEIPTWSEGTWSPDGKQLVLSIRSINENDTRSDLYRIDLNGNVLGLLTGNVWYMTSHTAPSWSPDGEWVAYYSDGEVYLADSEGNNNRHPIFHNTFCPGDQFQWAPDSKHLIVVTNVSGCIPDGPRKEGGSNLIMIYDLDSNSTNSTGINLNDANSLVAFSPDGTKIAYTEKSKPYLYDLENDCCQIEIDEFPIWWTSQVYPQWGYTTFDTPTAISTPTPEGESDISSSITSSIDGMTQLYIPEGEFQMGSYGYKNDEVPIHTVYINSFYIDKHEVTEKQFKEFLSATGYEATPCWYKDNYPVTCIDWFAAESYCEWAGRDLPTEAQWENAARGGLDDKLYPWGDNHPVHTLGENNGAYLDSAHGYHTGEIMGFSPNGYGIYDMVGNVWEWVADWYNDDYYHSSPYANPLGPSLGTYRILRGGAWSSTATSSRVSNRYFQIPSTVMNTIGFRCAESIP